MKIGIHQPNYIPWVGYFHKILLSDVFVFLDNVEYTSGVSNRNKIKTRDGWMWLTVPTKRSNRSHSKVSEVLVDNSKKWQKIHWNSIKTYYGNAPRFKEFEPFFQSFFSKNWEKLSDMNMFFITETSKMLGIEGKFLKASDMDLEGARTDLLINICKKLGANEYISGKGSKNYLEVDKFEKAGIKVVYQDFDYPTYNQRLVPPFVKNLSIIDILLNEGQRTFDIIKNL